VVTINQATLTEKDLLNSELSFKHLFNVSLNNPQHQCILKSKIVKHPLLFAASSDFSS